MKCSTSSVKRWMAAAFVLLATASARADFTNVVTLTLQQGVIPQTNGVNVVSAGAYTGCVDTYVYRESPTTAYGDATGVRFGGAFWTNSTPSNASRAFIRFDDFANALPPGAKILRGYLYLTSAGDWASGSIMELHYTTSSWTTNITWNTCPAIQAVIGSIDGVGAAWPSNTVNRFDISGVLQAWRQGTVTNGGLVLKCNEDGEPHGGRSFLSSEYNVASNRPKLVIEYALSGVLVTHPGWYNREGRQDVIITNGASVFEDTYLSLDHLNHATNVSVRLCTYNQAPYTPKRALLKLILANEPLASMAKRTDPLKTNTPRLVSARLQVGLANWMQEWFQLWACSQTWFVSQVTDQTRDGTNGWSAAWVDTGISNVGTNFGTQSFDTPFRASSCGWDITTVVQDYIDGTNNTGFVLGQASGAAYNNWLAFTEYSVAFQRPTLILQTWTPSFHGTVILVR